MQGFTSGSSWECKEWFETFSSQFPNYTSPGIWIAAAFTDSIAKRAG